MSKRLNPKASILVGQTSGNLHRDVIDFGFAIAQDTKSPYSSAVSVLVHAVRQSELYKAYRLKIGYSEGASGKGKTVSLSIQNPVLHNPVSDNHFDWKALAAKSDNGRSDKVNATEHIESDRLIVNQANVA